MSLAPFLRYDPAAAPAPKDPVAIDPVMPVATPILFSNNPPGFFDPPPGPAFGLPVLSPPGIMLPNPGIFKPAPCINPPAKPIAPTAGAMAAAIGIAAIVPAPRNIDPNSLPLDCVILPNVSPPVKKSVSLPTWVINIKNPKYIISCSILGSPVAESKPPSTVSDTVYNNINNNPQTKACRQTPTKDLIQRINRSGPESTVRGIINIPKK